MDIKQIYTGCLAQGAYYIEHNGEAAIIDPLRSVQSYIDLANENNAKIKYIFETHFHADFVSGHLTLSEKTGASIVYGPNAETSFDAIIAEDGQEFKLGGLTIVVLHTPGHTMESSTFLLRDENGKDHAIFTGDTLFLGDVGRPDLAQKSGSLTIEDLAGYSFESLRNKIMPLSDDVIVYPAHGAGSACGKNMMKETVDTLGNQKKVNYALRADMTKDEFIKEVTNGLAPPPAYFPLNVKMNKEGYLSFDKVLENSQHAFSPDEFEKAAEETGAVVLDVRDEFKFKKGHIPRSIFIGLNGDFAPWVGNLIKDVNQEILLVVEEGKLEEAITRLSRIGFDSVIGHLDGEMKSWIAAGKEVDKIETIDPKELANWPEENIVDVRRPSEFTAEHVMGAKNFQLTNINDYISEIPQDKPVAFYCEGGYRSVIANSILKSRGVHNIVDVKGGFEEIRKSEDVKTTAFVCPSTLS